MQPIGSPRVPVWATVACVVAAAWTVARSLDAGPLPEVTRFRDDAYYYFEWATNVALGSGPTVSAGATTSGVHLLWALVLTAARAMGADLVWIAPWLGLGIHAATAVAVGRMAGAGTTAVAMGALYLGQPLLLREAQNGQETALALAATAALWACRRRGAVRFAAVSALAILARSDLGFAVLGLSLWRASSVRRWRWRGQWCAVPVVAMVPYALANLALAGHPMQDSAAPVPWLMNANFSATEPRFEDWVARLWWLFRPCLLGWPWTLGSMLVPALWLVGAFPVIARAGRVVPLLAVAVAASLGLEGIAPLWIAALCVLAEPLCHRRSRGGAGAWLFAAMFAMVAVHFVVRAYPRAYYFAPLLAAGLVAIGPLVCRWPLLLVLLAMESALDVERPWARMEWQEEMAMAGRFVDRFVDPGMVIGCFNSGLVTYHREGPVANLDGVVDRRAFAALRLGQQAEHWRALGIRWLLDNPAQFSRDPGLLHASGRWISPDFERDRDLVEVARFVAPGGNALRAETEDFRLYWWTDGGRVPLPPRSHGPALVDLGAAEDGGRYVLWRGARGAALRLVAETPVGGALAEVVATGAPGVAQVLAIRPRAGRWRLVGSASGEVLSVPFASPH